jgi:predicted amidophosphoribosyltransferase
MKCPSCNAPVEDGADLCLECGEPMGDSPAAKAARAENVIRPPATAFAPPKPAAPTPSPTMPAKPSAKKKWATEEPEPLRCPGCGVKSHAARCPNCGNKLKPDDG